MNKLFLIISILFSIKCFALDAESLGRGGTYLTKSSMTQSMLYSPSNLKRNNTSVDLGVSLSGSKSFIDLAKEDHDIESDYERRLSPYFGTAISAESQGGLGINYKGITFFPYLLFVDGKAQLNDPAYPYADVVLKENQGFGFGYGGQYEKFIYGISVANFITKKREFIANVLNYDELSNEIETYSRNYLGNVSLGYQLNDEIIVLGNYQYKEFLKDSSDFAVGSKISLKKLDFLIEMHDIENLNFYNSFHAGIDYNPFKVLTLKLGSNQSYPTYGASLNFKYFKLNASSSGHNQFEQYRKEFRVYSFDLSFGYNL